MKGQSLRFGLIVFVLFFSACSTHPKKAFEALKKLEGHWKSTGNVIVYESWTLKNDSLLTGYRFAKQGKNNRVLEQYRIERTNEDVQFILLHPGKASGEDAFPLVKSWFDAYTFENDDAVYPNRILLDFDDDSVFVSRKENSRGNKRIEFEMKRWEE